MVATPVGTACPCKVGAPGSSTADFSLPASTVWIRVGDPTFENKSGVSPHALTCKCRNMCLDTSPTWERRRGFSP